jgi:transketolase
MREMQQGKREKVEMLRDLASAVRRRDLQVVHEARLGHVGGEISATDILVTLYFAVLRIDANRPDDPERDRFILSKGHSAVALYTTLAHAGFFPLEELKTFAQPLFKLNGHPDRKKVPGVETNTGPLGHGLPAAVGAALAAKLQDSSWRVFGFCCKK